MAGDSDEVWMDPDQLRVASSEASTVAELLGWEATMVGSRLYQYEMAEWGSYATEILSEVAEELGLLSRVATEKAYQIEQSANGGYAGGTGDLYDALKNSLDDGLGAKGTDEDDDPGYTVTDAQEWLERHPDYSPWAFSSEMQEAVASGNDEAIALLSESLWVRIDGMSHDEVYRFIHSGIGQQVFMVAVEASPPPATEAVTDALADCLWHEDDEWFDEYREPFALYLAEKYGIMGPDDQEQWASGKLLEFSRQSPEVAQTVLEYVSRIAEYPNLLHAHPAMGELVRRIVSENPETFKTILGDDLLTQKVVDIMADGASEQEVQQIFLDYAEWATSRFGPAGGQSSYGLSIGVLYRAITKTGHGIGYDWSALLKTFVPWAEFAAGGVPLFTSISELDNFIIDDDTYKELGDGSEEDIDKINAALVILMLTEPAAAQVIIDRLATQDLGPGAVTRDQWNDRTKGEPVDPPLTDGSVYCTAETFGDRATNFCVPTLEQAETLLTDAVEVIDGAWD